MTTYRSCKMNIAFPLLIALYSALCANGLKVRCPSEWTRWHGGCYRSIKEPSSWDNAEAFCRKYRLAPRRCPRKTAHLVTIDSKEENDFLYSWWKSHGGPVALATNEHFWIGMNDKEDEGKFVLINGNSPKYLNWANDQPDDEEDNQDCVQMSKAIDHDSGRWDDVACGVTSAFVCEFRCH